MQKETLAQMNLLEDFLFETVLSYPELGEKVGKKMLEIIFGRKIGKVRVVPQKNFNGSDIGFHGARLDVYMEEESDGQLQDSGSVYDIEPERDERLKSIKTLPRRVRFYHSKIDAKGLRAGMDYGKLKNVTIIMITPFDPFGMDRVKYTIRRGCLEEPDMPYDDGEETVFFRVREADLATESSIPFCIQEDSTEKRNEGCGSFSIIWNIQQRKMPAMKIWKRYIESSKKFDRTRRCH